MTASWVEATSTASQKSTRRLCSQPSSYRAVTQQSCVTLYTFDCSTRCCVVVSQKIKSTATTIVPMTPDPTHSIVGDSTTPGDVK